MITRLKYCLMIFAFISLSCWSADTPKIQIKKFRFHQHTGLDFERLVLEFSQKGTSAPIVRVAPSENGKEALLNIENATLVGAIPEAAINDSYSKTSNHIGPISINNDNPTIGFSIRTFIKSTHVSLDAFWLKNPARLIIDVYPKNSLRAQGPDVLKFSASRGLASQKAGGGSIKNRNVICFFAGSQVEASLGFELGAQPKPLNMNVDTANANYETEKNVICYPYSAQAQPKVVFDLKTTLSSPRARLDFAPSKDLSFSKDLSSGNKKLDLLPSTKSDWNAGRPLTKAEELNRDADLALGLPDDSDLEGRGLASPGLFGGTDNFDKSKPPPSLGKSLSGVKGSSGQRTPLLANPGLGGLLPQTKKLP